MDGLPNKYNMSNHMKVYARPIGPRIRKRNAKFSSLSGQKMGSQHAYEIERISHHHVALVGYSLEHTMTYTTADYTYENVMGEKITLDQAIALMAK